jgi:SAM-dependent methyltransferase
MSDGPAAFDRYARWYDAFNRDKDYAAEVGYIVGEAKRFVSSPRRWLDIGCGTGKHLACLHGHGIAAEGMDASPSMIARARIAYPEFSFHVGTAQDFHLPGSWDVISMLFHVMSYLTRDTDVDRALARIAAHLDRSGLLIFDFWHTGGVLHDPPARRVRESEVDGRKLFRIAIPTENRGLRRVDVRYEFRWDSVDGDCVLEEQHSMRHFSPSELTEFLGRAGLTVISCKGWQRESPPGPEDWYGVICARPL